MGVTEKLPIEVVDNLLRNDLAGSVNVAEPQTVDNPLLIEKNKVDLELLSEPSITNKRTDKEDAFPVCVVGRTIAMRGEGRGDDGDSDDNDVN